MAEGGTSLLCPEYSARPRARQGSSPPPDGHEQRTTLEQYLQPTRKRQTHTVRETPRHATTQYPYTDSYLYTNTYTYIHSYSMHIQRLLRIHMLLHTYIQYKHPHRLRIQRYVALTYRRLLTYGHTLIQTSIPTSTYIHIYTYILPRDTLCMIYCTYMSTIRFKDTQQISLIRIHTYIHTYTCIQVVGGGRGR